MRAAPFVLSVLSVLSVLGVLSVLSWPVMATTPAYHWALPAEYQVVATDSPLSINFRNSQQVLLNLTFHVDDEWRDVDAGTMRDEFIEGLLAVPGVSAGRRFVLQLPTVTLGAQQLPARQFFCRDWQGPGLKPGSRQIGRLCVLAKDALRVVVSLSSPASQAKVAAEDYQLALSSLQTDWAALVALRDSQP